MKNSKSLLFALLALLCLTLILPPASNAQRRDYLTDAEIELVRDANEIDKRIDVLVKAIDRRIMVINNDTTQEKQLKKDAEKWGELPSGTKTELLSDISSILQKAIDDIDDLFARKSLNEKLMKVTTENETEEEAQRVLKSNDQKFPLAVHNLADASRRYLPLFESFGANAANEREKGAVLRAIESCNSIIEASAQVQKPEVKKKKNKGN